MSLQSPSFAPSDFPQNLLQYSKMRADPQQTYRAIRHQSATGPGDNGPTTSFIIPIIVKQFLGLSRATYTICPRAVLIRHEVIRKCFVYKIHHVMHLFLSCQNICLSQSRQGQRDFVGWLSIPNLKVNYSRVACSYHGTMLGMEKLWSFYVTIIKLSI